MTIKNTKLPPHVNDIPIELCRSTMMFRISNNTYENTAISKASYQSTYQSDIPVVLGFQNLGYHSNRSAYVENSDKHLAATLGKALLLSLLPFAMIYLFL